MPALLSCFVEPLPRFAVTLLDLVIPFFDPTCRVHIIELFVAPFAVSLCRQYDLIGYQVVLVVTADAVVWPVVPADLAALVTGLDAVVWGTYVRCRWANAFTDPLAGVKTLCPTPTCNALIGLRTCASLAVLVT